MTITTVLVANRGEIARRVFATCRTLGLATVAVHSDPDADAPHVREADAAVRLPGATAAETYLRGDLIIEAAQRAGADAIHPGYGFLSENAGFARAVIEAGLTWIGPPPESIDAMGDKISAKARMSAAGVPLLADLDPSTITESDLPVLVKASAGGGGRGMRIVRTLDTLDDEVRAAQSEAQSAFGDPTVFVEPFVETGHHVEVQVMADTHGTVWAVGERECSIQRRHQKVVEEAPSPLVERHLDMREPLYSAAIEAARAIGYEGAGTVEFLADDDGRFWFLEMNTRLQVEHPVTELTTGLDLVALQIHIANGEPLPAQTPPASAGSAIEVRLYAEDPSAGWQPQSGTLRHLQIPGVTAEFTTAAPGGSGVRLDAGVVDGSVVGVNYDPMLAKVIAWAPTRAWATALLTRALESARIHGLKTNRDLLVGILRHEEFRSGNTDTAFLGRHGSAELSRTGDTEENRALAAVVATLADAAHQRASATVQAGLPMGFRSLPSQMHSKTFSVDGTAYTTFYALAHGTLTLVDHPSVKVLAQSPSEVVLSVSGVRRQFTVARSGAEVDVDGPFGGITLLKADRLPSPEVEVVPGSLLAPMPAVVAAVHVSQGDAVETGQLLLVLEAMKMQHSITATVAGTVTELPVQTGQNVEVGSVLAVITDGLPAGDITDEKESQ